MRDGHFLFGRNKSLAYRLKAYLYSDLFWRFHYWSFFVVHCPKFSHLSPLSNVQCPMSNVHCPMSIVQCPLSNVHCPMSNVQCPMSNVQCPMSNVHCPMSIVQCPELF